MNESTAPTVAQKHNSSWGASVTRPKVGGYAISSGIDVETKNTKVTQVIHLRLGGEIHCIKRSSHGEQYDNFSINIGATESEA